MIKDSAVEKWIYREHTRVKHVLLEKYLRAWIRILGRYHGRICYFDGFAGRGEYMDGSPGSPLIAMKVAEELHSYFNEFVCVNIEKDADNFANLEDTVKKEKNKYPHVKIINIQDEFANVIEGMLDEVSARLAPSFFFIDPFGFSGVPFRIVKAIFSITRTEVFFTYMCREISRFLNSDKVERIFDELFGTRDWRQILEEGFREEQREHALRDLYIRQLSETAGVQYTWPFRVCMTEKVQTLYYLIHATNNFKGLSIMKNVMYNQSPEGKFAYLGPEDFAVRHQISLFDPEDISSLKEFLFKRFTRCAVTYDKIEKETYMETPHIDKHYRKALKELGEEGKVKIKRISSKTARGLRDKDEVTFS